MPQSIGKCFTDNGCSNSKRLDGTFSKDECFNDTNKGFAWKALASQGESNAAMACENQAKGECFKANDCTGETVTIGQFSQSSTKCFKANGGASYKETYSTTCTVKDSQLDEDMQVELDLDLAEADAELSMLDVEAEFAADLADA
eukprot:tig00000403_g257.t1